jgi:hypothetical protein
MPELWNSVVDPHGSLLIFAVLDPDPYWECQSGSGEWKLTENNILNLVFYISKRLF